MTTVNARTGWFSASSSSKPLPFVRVSTGVCFSPPVTGVSLEGLATAAGLVYVQEAGCIAVDAPVMLGGFHHEVLSNNAGDDTPMQHD